MSNIVRRLIGAAAVLSACVALPASAAVITFDAMGPNLFFPGDSFSEAGFKMTVDFDFGTVDLAANLPAPTSGNSTQVYFNSNDGGLIVERNTGQLFNLNSFQAALVPQTLVGQLSTVIVALATDAFGGQFGSAFLFPTAVGGVNPFATYSNGLAGFHHLRSVEFFACSFVNNQVCTTGTNDAGQFAIDNINVTSIPEPASIALVMCALLGLGLSTRRSVR